MGRRYTKKENQRFHARQRAMERYGISYTRVELAEILGLIRGGKSLAIERQSLRVSIHTLLYKEQPVRVVYDKNTKEIASFLPLQSDGQMAPDDLPYNGGVTNDEAKRFRKRMIITASRMGFPKDAEDIAQEGMRIWLQRGLKTGTNVRQWLDMAVVDAIRGLYGSKRPQTKTGKVFQRQRAFHVALHEKIRPEFDGNTMTYEDRYCNDRGEWEDGQIGRLDGGGFFASFIESLQNQKEREVVDGVLAQKSMREIAKEMDITESRVSQILTQVIERIWKRHGREAI